MSTALQRSYQALAREHEEIMALVGRLVSISDAVDLTGPLEELHGLLIRHFAHEQFPGGLYETMGAYSAEHHDLLRELVREHCAILASLGALAERSRNSAGAVGLRDDVASLVQVLRRHEQREHALAARLLGSDAP